MLVKSYYALAAGNFQVKNFKPALKHLGLANDLIKVFGQDLYPGNHRLALWEYLFGIGGL